MTKLELANAILILERVGLADAFLDMVGVLDSDGQDKYGDQGWRDKAPAKHIGKAIGHLDRRGLDLDSGRQHASHAAARSLMLAQLGIEELRGGRRD